MEIERKWMDGASPLRQRLQAWHPMVFALGNLAFGLSGIAFSRFWFCLEYSLPRLWQLGGGAPLWVETGCDLLNLGYPLGSGRLGGHRRESRGALPRGGIEPGGRAERK